MDTSELPVDFIIKELENNAQVFSSLLNNNNQEQYLFKPSPGKWSLLEIVCHLVDEEREDFRQRVKTTLNEPGTAPPPIDPEGWVTSRNYAQQDYDKKVAEFLEERNISIHYLEHLDNPQWENYYDHPKLGPLSADHFLRNWLAHDYIHIRQINRNKFLYFKSLGSNDLSYAGNW